MMNSIEQEARALIARLRGEGVRLTVTDGRVRVEPPLGRIAIEDKHALERARDTVRALLLQEHEFDELNEPGKARGIVPSSNSLNSSAFASAQFRRSAILARVRTRASARLRAMSDEDLQAVCDWHILHAFAQGKAANFRRFLPPALQGLTDDEVVDLVDWAGIATLEAVFNRRGAGEATLVRRAAHDLAVWWNSHQPQPAARLAAQRADALSLAVIDRRGGAVRPEVPDLKIGARVRTETLELAAAAGFPRLPFAPPRAVAAGAHYWESFVTVNDVADVAKVGDLLRTLLPGGRIECHATVSGVAEVLTGRG